MSTLYFKLLYFISRVYRVRRDVFGAVSGPRDYKKIKKNENYDFKVWAIYVGIYFLNSEPINFINTLKQIACK